MIQSADDDALHELLTLPPSRWSASAEQLRRRLLFAPTGPRWVVVVVERHRRWGIGLDRRIRGQPIEVLAAPVFDARIDAEREVYRRRHFTAAGRDP